MYSPKSKKELIELIVDCYHNKLYLKDIDVSLITDMSELFDYDYYEHNYKIDINKIWENPKNDISNWDTSNVTDMSYMFYESKFNQDISKWNTLNVTDMYGMFYESEFNRDISEWNVSSVTDMKNIFYGSKFSQDISLWILSLNPNVDMVQFNNYSEHSKIYGDINSYEDFIQTINWSNVKEYIKEIMDNGSNKERYELLKRFNNLKWISNIELDISK